MHRLERRASEPLRNHQQQPAIRVRRLRLDECEQHVRFADWHLDVAHAKRRRARRSRLAQVRQRFAVA
jgi:hypothetical protein